ncbi:MAG TPA: response regulator [Lachnospiraceae bacterium]
MLQLRLMIVEDEEKSRKLLAFLISEMNLGFEDIIEVANGEEALAELYRLQPGDLPDVLLTDIRMPKMDGLDLVKAVGEAFPSIRRIIVTAYDEFEYARSAMRLGVHDFLLKPFNRAEIKKSLEKVKEEIEKEEKGKDLPLSLIEKAKLYIEENLGDANLSLTSIANACFVNPSYLSRQFKKEMDVNFSDYLLRKRIEKAIFCIEHSDLKAYEIAEKIGILDAKYFGKCFKKITGRAFAEFKKEK